MKIKEKQTIVFTYTSLENDSSLNNKRSVENELKRIMIKQLVK